MDDPRVPGPLRLAAALSWRLLAVALAVGLIAFLLAQLRVIIIPAFIAVLLSTLLVPMARALRGRGVPNALATITAVAGGLLAVLAVGAVLLPPIIDDLSDVDGLRADAEAGIDRVREWLTDGPLGLSEQEVDRYYERAQDEVQSNAQRLAGGAISGALLVVELIVGAVLTLVLTFFFVKDGARFWDWFVTLFAPRMQPDAQAIGERSWRVLSGYVRGTIGVAAVDAVFIGLALLLIGVPFVAPLAVLTFLGGLVPIVGAFAAGLVAVLVALGTEGFLAAALVLAAIVAVQQLEGNLVAPVLVGRSVNIHPVAVVLAVTAGSVLWGVLGAFVAVPLAAVVRAVAGYLSNRPVPEAMPSPPAEPSEPPVPESAEAPG